MLSSHTEILILVLVFIDLFLGGILKERGTEIYLPSHDKVVLLSILIVVIPYNNALLFDFLQISNLEIVPTNLEIKVSEEFNISGCLAVSVR